MDVFIAFDRNELPATHFMRRAVAEGRIQTWGQHDAVREQLIRDRQARIEIARAPVQSAIERLGGRLLSRPKNLHTLAARVPAGKIEELLAAPGVARIDLAEPGGPEAPDGLSRRIGQQLDGLIADGFNGERDTHDDITFAHYESDAIDDEIFAYRENAGTGTRFMGRYVCASGSCSSTSNFTENSESDHPSRTASIIFGDLAQGQDSTVTTTSSRINRSGFATEAQGYFYTGGGNFLSALDHVAGISNHQPIAMNLSMWLGLDDCTGQDGISRAVNELFESGTLLFKSAGNEGHATSANCTATVPGAAIGAFTVAAYGDDSSVDADDVRTDGICEHSSRGGTTSPDPEEGNGRSIIDLAAYAPHDRMASIGNSYHSGGCWTSYAAPAALGASITFADHYYMTYSNVLNDPGYLHTVMLLMGDRKGQSGILDTGFDNIWGAGRLRMRRFGGNGMDSPWGYALGDVCVDNNESVSIPINGGNALSGDVDAFKAVIYWYDSRHGVDGTLDDVDLYLKVGGIQVAQSTSATDEKERIRYGNIETATTFELVVHGADVTADNGGCGSNSQRVYYGYFYEDSDRNDVDGPGAEVLEE